MVTKIFIAAGVLLIAGVFFMPQLTWMSAKKAFDKENVGKPWAPQTAYKAGKINLRFMRYRPALAIFERTLRTWPNASFRGDCAYQIGLCYQKTKQYEKAVVAFEAYLTANPNHYWRDQARKRIEDIKADSM